MITLNKENFPTEVENFPGLVVVDFWAPWCGPCRMVAPILEELAAQYKDDPAIKFAKVNVDEQLELANRFKIRGIPTIKFFKNGKEVDQFVGAAPKQTFVEIINKFL